MKNVFIIIACLVMPMLSKAQQSLSLEECQIQARQNYPLSKQHDLITKSKEYSVSNASKGYFPQLSIAGQATYQSDVTVLPISLPNIHLPSLSNDQYKVYAELTQVIFDGGIIGAQKKTQEANAAVEAQKLEVELYKLKDRINQLYFGILMIDEQLKLVDLMKKDLASAMSKANASVANGIALKMSVDLIKVEDIKSDQKAIELRSMRNAYISMLGFFLNKQLTENTLLSRPTNINPPQEIHRPELMLFEFQSKMIDVQNQIISAKNLPKLNLFVQGGYGRPALNMLSNSFDPYAIGGVRFNWPLSGFYTSKKERSIIDVNKKTIDIQKEAFLFNTSLALKQQDSEIQKLKELIRSDEEIVALRTRIKSVSETQHSNGVINSSDYLRELNAEDAAKQNQLLHEIQLLMAQYNLQATSGN